MKQIYLLILSLFPFFFINAQQNFPSPSESPFWTESHSTLWTCSYSNDCNGYYCECITPVYYKSDTIINGLKYNRLYSRGICHAIWAGGPPVGCPFTFEYSNPETLFALIRQDTIDKIVYLWDGERDTLLYDFKNILVGQLYPQTYTNLFHDELVVVSEDSILLDNFYIKKWNLGMKINEIIYDSAFASIIEGIGSSFGILANLVPPFENNDQLLCFSKNDFVLFPDSTYDCDKTVIVSELEIEQNFSIYPNPATRILTIETEYVYKKSCFLSIINITGTEMFSQEIKETTTKIDVSTLAQGIYIVRVRNGKFVETTKFVKD